MVYVLCTHPKHIFNFSLSSKKNISKDEFKTYKWKTWKWKDSACQTASWD